ncbi:unnamed protein product [Pocillopora meandrina]|uniref:Uncharacterized protein n=1 Tax=Pocillopora meandrina TaxID=46732 RepID=A0AAU9WHA5_9CNID|nr:unnamed protein product [Pocillopora meandrina]
MNQKCSGFWQGLHEACQTLSALTHLLTEVNESVEEWKESSHKMEKNRDYWRKKAINLEKKLYCKQCLSRQKEVEDLHDGETMELCAECAERLHSRTDTQERLKFLETQIKHWQNSSAFESTRYLTLLYKIHWQITDSALLNKAGRVAAEEQIIVNNPKMPDAIANQQTREMLQERRRLTKRLRDIPSVPTADLADVESEESAMTEGIVENLLKRMAKKQKKKLQDEIAPLKTPKKEIPAPGTSKIPARIKK